MSMNNNPKNDIKIRYDDFLQIIQPLIVQFRRSKPDESDFKFLHQNLSRYSKDQLRKAISACIDDDRWKSYDWPTPAQIKKYIPRRHGKGQKAARDIAAEREAGIASGKYISHGEMVRVWNEYVSKKNMSSKNNNPRVNGMKSVGQVIDKTIKGGMK